MRRLEDEIYSVGIVGETHYQHAIYRTVEGSAAQLFLSVRIGQEAITGDTPREPRKGCFAYAALFAILGAMSIDAGHLAAKARPQAAATPEAVRQGKLIGGWYVSRGKTDCSMLTEYSRSVSLYVSFDARRDDSHLVLVDPSFRSVKQGDTFALDVYFGGGRQAVESYTDVSFRGIRLEDGKPGVSALFAGSAFLRDFARAARMLIKRDDATVALLELNGSAAAVADLRSCAERVSRETPSDPFDDGKSTDGAARPIGSPAAWVTNDDYPPSALRAGEQGVVTILVGVDLLGRVSSCSVTESSGSPTLDEATCRLVQRRGRFHPAQNARGESVAGSFTTRIAWRLG